MPEYEHHPALVRDAKRSFRAHRRSVRGGRLWQSLHALAVMAVVGTILVGCAGEAPVSGDGSDLRGAALLLLVPAFGAVRLRNSVSRHYSLTADDRKLFTVGGMLTGIAAGVVVAWGTISLVDLSESRFRVSGLTFVLALGAWSTFAHRWTVLNPPRRDQRGWSRREGLHHQQARVAGQIVFSSNSSSAR